MPDQPRSQEDEKLVTLARSARVRVGAAEGAAVRDGEGRSYVGATVDRPSLRLSALRLAVANAIAAGATTLEAAAVVTAAAELPAADRAAVADLTPDAPVHVVPVRL